MKIKTHTGIARLALCASMILALTACSHGPSESDAKQAIQARLGDCKYFSIDSFDKTNGIPVDDNDYQVEVKYTIKMLPVDENKAAAEASSGSLPQFAVNVVRGCPDFPRGLIGQFFDGKTPIADYADDVTYSFTETLNMVKTDAGWQEAR